MGDSNLNIELYAHAQATGPIDQGIRIHHGEASLNEEHKLDLDTWNGLRAAARANDRTGYDTLIRTVPVTGGWPTARLDAAWVAGVQNWVDNSSHS